MITLQLSTTSHPISWAIRRATFSPVSHVDIVLPDGRLLGSHWQNGVQVRRSNYGNFTRIIRADVACTESVMRTVILKALGEVGKPYDKGAIFNLLLQRDWRENDKWFCSELVAWAFEKAGDPLLNPNMAAWRISPRDLLLSTRLSWK